MAGLITYLDNHHYMDSTHTWMTSNKIIRTQTFDTKADGDWITVKRRWDPVYLESNAAYTIIDNCSRIQDIDQLSIPDVLKQNLYALYLSRKLQCRKTHTSVELHMKFDTQFERVSADERITIHFGYSVPKFAYEKNILTYYWYCLDDDPTRLCPYCWHHRDLSNHKYLTRFTTTDVSFADDILADLWVSSAWCEECKLTALFRIEDYEDDSNHPIRNFRVVRRCEKISL